MILGVTAWSCPDARAQRMPERTGKEGTEGIPWEGRESDTLKNSAVEQESENQGLLIPSNTGCQEAPGSNKVYPCS